MSNLTVESLQAMWESLKDHMPPREPGITDFLRPFPRFGGMKIYEAPAPAPKIQLRDIQHADGTSILTPEFRRQMQDWLTARFGYQEDLFKDHCYILGNHTIIASPRHMAMIRDSVA